MLNTILQNIQKAKICVSRTIWHYLTDEVDGFGEPASYVRHAVVIDTNGTIHEQLTRSVIVKSGQAEQCVDAQRL